VAGTGSAGAMAGLDERASIAESYRFAEVEAAGRSPTYQRLAEGVAEDASLLDYLISLPPDKRQPNLLFAVARYLLDGPVDLGSCGSSSPTEPRS
jgi:Uncharacterized protein conserved in bacteria (DUF2332)